MVYELVADSTLAQFVQKKFNTKVIVIVVVCWMQQFVDWSHGSNTGWISHVEHRVNFGPQLEDDVQRLTAWDRNPT